MTTEPNLSPAHHEVQAALHLQAIDQAAATFDGDLSRHINREGLAIRAQMAHAHAALALTLRVAEMQGPSALQIIGTVDRG